jgi:hydrogenase expression/formation protein HypD
MIRRIERDEALARLRVAATALGERHVTFMEVCGTHTVSAFRSGLHSLMPDNVRLLSGPGCPVCVTSQSDVDRLISLASLPGVVLCTYGDMIRVVGSNGSLQDARAAGADVRVVYSALDAVDLAAKLADESPRRQVVFAAVGFETTAPATAVAIREASRRGLDNFCAFASHKRVMPAMHALLDSGELRVDGFLLPGHVGVITGSREFEPIVDRYQLPCVVSGFEGEQIAASLALLAELCVTGEAKLVNLYPQAVGFGGNAVARSIIDEVFEPCTADWRGLAIVPASGLRIREQFAKHDASRRFEVDHIVAEEPRGCRCGDVITGRCSPADCKLFGTACTPVQPIGPCMVSSEGTCAAWFKYKRGSASPTRHRTSWPVAGGVA